MNEVVDIRKELMTPSVALSVIPAFHIAYSMASEVVKSNDFLGGPLKDQMLPLIKNAAVEFELHRRAQQGLIPFDAQWVTNSRRNHTHLELKRNGFVLTVSQTHFWYEVPRRCVFRNDHNIDGQLALDGFDTVASDQKDVYAILTHGWKGSAPSFLYCGVPNAEMSAWIDGINLQNEFAEIRLAETPKIAEEIVLEFKTHIARRKNG